MTLSQAIVERIKNLINQSTQIENYHQLSTKAGLNESVIRAILSGGTKKSFNRNNILHFCCIWYYFVRVL